jgi:hypothetical protein
MTTTQPTTVDQQRMTRAQRAALPLTTEVAQAVAEQLSKSRSRWPNSTPNYGHSGCGAGCRRWTRHRSRSAVRHAVGRTRRTCPVDPSRNGLWGGCSPAATGPPLFSPSLSIPTGGWTVTGRRWTRIGMTTGGPHEMPSISPRCLIGSGRTRGAMSDGTCSTSAPSNHRSAVRRISTPPSAAQSLAPNCGRLRRRPITSVVAGT